MCTSILLQRTDSIHTHVTSLSHITAHTHSGSTWQDLTPADIRVDRYNVSTEMIHGLLLSAFIPALNNKEDFEQTYALLIGSDDATIGKIPNYRDAVFKPAVESVKKDGKLAQCDAFWKGKDIEVNGCHCAGFWVCIYSIDIVFKKW